MELKEKALEWAMKMGLPNVTETIHAATQLFEYFSEGQITYPDRKVYYEPEKILQATAMVYNMSVSQMLANSRKQQLVFARNSAATLLKLHTPLSLTEIAEKLKFGDHSTVIHALKRTESLLINSNHFKSKFIEIKASL